MDEFEKARAILADHFSDFNTGDLVEMVVDQYSDNDALELAQHLIENEIVDGEL